MNITADTSNFEARLTAMVGLPADTKATDVVTDGTWILGHNDAAGRFVPFRSPRPWDEGAIPTEQQLLEWLRHLTETDRRELADRWANDPMPYDGAIAYRLSLNDPGTPIHDQLAADLEAEKAAHPLIVVPG